MRVFTSGEAMSSGHIKRLACQIAAQMPDDEDEALEVLRLVREVVMNLDGGWGEVRSTPTRLYAINPAASQATETEGQPARRYKANPE